MMSETVFIVAEDYGYNNYGDFSITVFANRDDAEAYRKTRPHFESDVFIWEKPVLRGTKPNSRKIKTDTQSLNIPHNCLYTYIVLCVHHINQ